MKIEELFQYYQGVTRKEFEFFYRKCSHPYAYASWLAQTYAYVIWTVPILLRVAENCNNQYLRTLLKKKAEEELNHDQYIIQDLQYLGFDISEFEISPPIQHLVDITSSNECQLSDLIGHMLVLEVMHPSLREVNNIISLFGVPAQATSAFRVHSEVDTDHARAVLTILTHNMVSKTRAFSSAIRVLQLFRDHWIWMSDVHMKLHK